MRRPALVPSTRVVLCALLSSVLGAGCSAHFAPRASSMRMLTQPQREGPRPLERSVFSRFPGGQLTEEALQTILASAPELELPARVGVLPIVPAHDSRGPTPDYREVPNGVRPLVETLRKGDTFSLVTEMLPIPSGALGMEALREIAARYRLRYILLYRELSERESELNGSAWGYPTLIGAFFLPGHTLRVRGYVEASLFDVKTGLLLFTTRRAMAREVYSTPFGHRRKHRALHAHAVIDAAPGLAADVRTEALRFADAARREAAARTSAHARTTESPATLPVPGGPQAANGP